MLAFDTTVVHDVAALDMNPNNDAYWESRGYEEGDVPLHSR